MMLNAQTGLGMPTDWPMAFGELGLLGRVVAITLLVVTGLLIWLFRARGSDTTSITVRRRPGPRRAPRPIRPLDDDGKRGSA